ncbi:MAG TPA: DUF1800 domain-containing protein [Candidatus Acidoferrales bacterium]|nr:DUF1800 domain-containing protein [Candidatus Acidoferrales bacterium]
MNRENFRDRFSGATHSRRPAPGAWLLAGLAAAAVLASPFLLNGNLAVANAATGAPSESATTSKALKGLPITQLSETEAILHALNRLGYGARPGDVERVREMGLAKWIDQQLNPDSISDDGMRARLEKYPTLRMSSSKLIEEFPRPQVAAKREGVTVEEYRKQIQQQQQAARAMMNGEGADGAAAGANGDEVARELQAMAGPDKASNLGKKGYNGGDPNKSPLLAYQALKTPQRIVAELAMAKMERAIYSDRQLEQVMDDFWFNHFNVFAGKGQDTFLLTSYERDAIQPNVFGKFENLVTATAKSPAMLFYLDNFQSVDPETPKRMAEKRPFRRGPFGGPMPPQQRPGQNPQQQQKKREFGINENYGRELMELHTLGVDGGYMQDDVIAVAKCFTGWTIRRPQQDSEFFFNDDTHVRGAKMVLGHKIDEGGMGDGLAVIKLLSHDPHTAHHISLQLAQHFVADNPPPALVDRMTKTFEEKDGDTRAVLRTMIYSPEFWTRTAYRAKIKTPFELVASAARAVGADVAIPLPLVMWTARIGEPLYQCQPPTGYKDDAATWVNTGALLNRLNYSLTLAGNRLRGARVDVSSLLGDDAYADPKLALDRSVEKLLNNDVAEGTRKTLEKQLADPTILQASLDDKVTQVNAGTVAGLVLGAPEFQRR